MSAKQLFAVLVLLAIVAGWILDRSRPSPVPAPLIVLPEPLKNSATPPLWPEPATEPAKRVLAGRVLGPSGQPVHEALVVRRGEQVSRWALSDRQGRFELRELPAGPLALDVIAWPWLPAKFNIADDSDASELRLGDPEPGLPRLQPFPRADLAGILRDSSGDPLGQYEVSFVPTDFANASNLKASWLSGRVPRRQETARDGSFELPELIEGSYRVEVRPPWARGGSWPDLIDASLASYEHATALASQPLALTTSVGAISGLVLDIDDQPVEGALLIPRSTENRQRLWPPETSAPDGRFTIPELPPGPYDLEILAGEAALVLAEISVTAGSTTQALIPPLQVSAP